MNHCETFEIRISALLDGELEPAEVVATLDHLTACAACRRFYAGARALDRAARPGGLAAAARPPDPAAGLPDGVWERIERSGRRAPAPFREWGLRAAALLVVGIGLWNIGGLRNETRPVPRPSYDIELGAGGGGMTEGRFVEMTAELLRSDRRYHDVMYEVLRDVRDVTAPHEGSEDGPAPAETEEGGGTAPETESRLPS